MPQIFNWICVRALQPRKNAQAWNEVCFGSLSCIKRWPSGYTYGMNGSRHIHDYLKNAYFGTAFPTYSGPNMNFNWVFWLMLVTRLLPILTTAMCLQLNSSFVHAHHIFKTRRVNIFWLKAIAFLCSEHVQVDSKHIYRKSSQVTFTLSGLFQVMHGLHAAAAVEQRVS